MDALDAETVTAWEAAGGGEATLVAAVAGLMGHGPAYAVAPSALLCPEPIVVTGGAWERGSRQAGGAERGTRALDVAVVRDTAVAAEAVCRALERDLHGYAWDAASAGWRLRIVAVDTGAPEARGRDGSGRFVWGFSMICTVAREL